MTGRLCPTTTVQPWPWGDALLVIAIFAVPIVAAFVVPIVLEGLLW